MRVEPNDNTPNAWPINPAKAREVSVPASAPEANIIDFGGSAQLLEKLEKTDETRADKIAAARALVQDPNYPNETTLRKVADVIADGLASERRSEG